jgi:hypothetical protein
MGVKLSISISISLCNITSCAAANKARWACPKPCSAARATIVIARKG